jgi:hypothetical protein
MSTTPHGPAEIVARFGNPANADGTLNKTWERANITKVSPPAGWKLYYQDKKLLPVTGIRMHRLLAPSFVSVLDEIWSVASGVLGAGASNDDIRAWLHANRYDQTGGGFNFRQIRGGSRLSLHSFGIAIDWDPRNNPRKKPITRTLPDWWYAIWNNHGWHDGRRFKTPDPMHVQFATGA